MKGLATFKNYLTGWWTEESNFWWILFPESGGKFEPISDCQDRIGNNFERLDQKFCWKIVPDSKLKKSFSINNGQAKLPGQKVHLNLHKITNFLLKKYVRSWESFCSWHFLLLWIVIVFGALEPNRLNHNNPFAYRLVEAIKETLGSHLLERTERTHVVLYFLQLGHLADPGLLFHPDAEQNISNLRLYFSGRDAKLMLVIGFRSILDFTKASLFVNRILQSWRKGFKQRTPVSKLEFYRSLFFCGSNLYILDRNGSFLLVTGTL